MPGIMSWNDSPLMISQPAIMRSRETRYQDMIAVKIHVIQGNIGTL
jgi:hypothetical protein